VLPGRQAAPGFSRLLDACEELARSKGASLITAGVNTARQNAYHQMLARGFRIDLLGVSMAKPSEAGYNRPDVYVLDDCR
jgi:hypothetical protein